MNDSEEKTVYQPILLSILIYDIIGIKVICITIRNYYISNKVG